MKKRCDNCGKIHSTKVGCNELPLVDEEEKPKSVDEIIFENRLGRPATSSDYSPKFSCFNFPKCKIKKCNWLCKEYVQMPAQERIEQDPRYNEREDYPGCGDEGYEEY